MYFNIIMDFFCGGYELFIFGKLIMGSFIFFWDMLLEKNFSFFGMFLF